MVGHQDLAENGGGSVSIISRRNTPTPGASSSAESGRVGCSFFGLSYLWGRNGISNQGNLIGHRKQPARYPGAVKHVDL